MKKIVLILLTISLLVFCVACGVQEEIQNQENFAASAPSSSENSSTPVVPDTHTFTGEVLSVEKGMILVSPDEENSAISPQIFVNISQFNDMTFEKGDRVRVTFNGQVAQSFPPQILGVINIEIIE